MINFGCPTCSEQMSLPANMAGGTVNCPKCGTLIQVPAAAAEPPAPQQIIVQSQSQRVIVNRGWGCLSLIGLVVVVCAVVPFMCTAGTCITCAGLGISTAPDIHDEQPDAREKRQRKRPTTSPVKDTAAASRPAPRSPATRPAPSPPPPKPANVPHPHADAIAAVKRTFRAGLEVSTIRSAPLKGGVAVLVDNDGAYWVHDGRVYAANGTAGTWSRGLKWSPIGIHFNSISEAVKAQIAKTVPLQPTTRATAMTRPAPPDPPVAASPPVNVPTYEVLKNKLYDAPIKTQVEMRILVTETVTEQGLRALLEKLYAEQMKRRGFTFHTKLTHVFIYVHPDKERGAEESTGWIAMLAKTGEDSKPDITVNKKLMAVLREKPVVKFGLTERQRKAVWREMIHAEDRSTKEAEAAYPLDPRKALDRAQFDKQVDMQRALNAKYDAQIAKRHGLTKKQLQAIAVEGATKQWPMP